MAIDTQFRTTASEHVDTDTHATGPEPQTSGGHTARPAPRTSMGGFLDNLARNMPRTSSPGGMRLSSLGGRLSAMLSKASIAGDELYGKIGGSNLLSHINAASRRHPTLTGFILASHPLLRTLDIYFNRGRVQGFNLPPGWRQFRASSIPMPGAYGGPNGSVPLRPPGMSPLEMFAQRLARQQYAQNASAQNRFSTNPFGGVGGRFGPGRFTYRPPFAQPRPAASFARPQYYQTTNSMPTYGTGYPNGASPRPQNAQARPQTQSAGPQAAQAEPPPVPPRPQNAQARPSTPPRRPDDSAQTGASRPNAEPLDAQTLKGFERLGLAPGASWHEVLGSSETLLGVAPGASLQDVLRSIRQHGDGRLSRKLDENTANGASPTQVLLMHVDDVEDAAKAAREKLHQKFAGGEDSEAVDLVLQQAWGAMLKACAEERNNIDSINLGGNDRPTQTPTAPERSADNLDALKFLDIDKPETATYHDILGVAPTASKADIRKAYFKLNLDYHPNRYRNLNPGADPTKLKRAANAHKLIDEAYNILK